MNDAETLSVALPGEVGLVAPEDFVCPDALPLESGTSLPGFTLRYETYGRLNRERSNAILICHALSGDHHCAGIHDLNDRKMGWWNNMIGPHKPIDTTRFFVLCTNALGGCQGSTGPSSINPETDQRWGSTFPAITVGDMVTAQAKLLDHLGIERLAAVVGGSMGGMQALQWARAYPDRVGKLLAMATTGRHSAQAIAFNEVGRRAIVQDPDWADGHYEADKGPALGLAIARMMAHITYLSDAGMERKFGRQRRADAADNLTAVEFEIESYLRYQGKSFINRFDANTYLLFTKALDRFDLYAGDGLDANLASIRARTLVIAFTSDWLYPPAQNRSLVHALLRNGTNATYAELTSDLGHDSFLLEDPILDGLVCDFLADSIA